MRYIKTALVIALLGFTIYLCFRNFQLNSQVQKLPKEVIEKTDTIYLAQKFKPTYYDELQNPSRILLFDYPNQSPNRILGRGSDGRDSVSVISEKDSLVNFTITSNQLSLSFLNQDSEIYSSRLYNIDLSNFKYSWYNGKLTYQEIKNRLTVKPYLYANYRLFNNLTDVGIGISFKTKRINYKLGVTSFYYPKFFHGIKSDLEFRLEYNF